MGHVCSDCIVFFMPALKYKIERLNTANGEHTGKKSRALLVWRTYPVFTAAFAVLLSTEGVEMHGISNGCSLGFLEWSLNFFLALDPLGVHAMSQSFCRNFVDPSWCIAAMSSPSANLKARPLSLTPSIGKELVCAALPLFCSLSDNAASVLSHHQRWSDNGDGELLAICLDDHTHPSCCCPTRSKDSPFHWHQHQGSWASVKCAPFTFSGWTNNHDGGGGPL